jgi:tetratricopeptide (TPR) repeat protein
LANSYLALDRLEDVRSTLDEAATMKMDSFATHLDLYVLAFLRNAPAGMSRQVAWSAGKPGVEDQFLAEEALTAAYSGRIGLARQFDRRAVALALQADGKEGAAYYETVAAIREALFGYRTEARQRAVAALRLSHGRDIEYGTALALAMAGDTQGAQTLADDLDNRYPSGTIVQLVCLPAIRGRLAIDHKDYARALEILQAAAPYELSWSTWTPSIYTAYVRGEAYLSGGQNGEAATEFQKILSHRGIVGNDPIGALAHLNLARAYAGQHDVAKAKDSYENFLGLWKDADPGIPILQTAKREHARLKP